MNIKPPNQHKSNQTTPKTIKKKAKNTLTNLDQKPKNSDRNLRTFRAVRSKIGEMRGVHCLWWQWQVTVGLEELGHGGYALREREREKVSHGGYVERERERERWSAMMVVAD